MNGIEILLTAICINSTCENTAPRPVDFTDFKGSSALDLNLESTRLKGGFYVVCFLLTDLCFIV